MPGNAHTNLLLSRYSFQPDSKTKGMRSLALIGRIEVLVRVYNLAYECLHDSLCKQVNNKAPATATASRLPLLPVPITRSTLDSHDFIGTRTFLTFANFKFYCLAVTKRRISSATLNFRMMNEKVFSSILRGNETKTFICVEPLDCTFTHICLP